MIADAQQQRGGGHRNQADAGRDDDGTGPLGPHEGSRDVEAVLRQKFTEMVAGHLAGTGFQSGAEHREIGRGEFPECRGDLGGPGDGGPVVGVGGMKSGAGGGQRMPVGGDEVQFDHVITGASVPDRVISAGVVADRATERRA